MLTHRKHKLANGGKKKNPSYTGRIVELVPHQDLRFQACNSLYIFLLMTDRGCTFQKDKKMISDVTWSVIGHPETLSSAISFKRTC